MKDIELIHGDSLQALKGYGDNHFDIAIVDPPYGLGYKILDTHLGSGSIAVACYDEGYDLVGIEIDEKYFEEASKRLKLHKQQLTLF